eukprot:3012550-Lingulodinium_polyedra.AAC.1
MRALAMYAGPRHVRVQGATAAPVVPTRGLLPGCAHAMALLHCFLRSSIAIASAAGPPAARRMADDIVVLSEHLDPDKVAEDV